jgi:hypothetical protein
MQRMLREAGRRLAWRSDRQAEQGLAVVKALLEANARQLQHAPMVKALINRMETAPIAYIAHEYMNAHWQPCFLADVTASLAEAKLDWVGSSELIENFPALTMTDEQRSVANRFDDPLMRELVKDLCVDRSLRHDLFVRGARRVANSVRDAALMDVVIGMNIDPDELPDEADVPAGKAQFNTAFYQPIVQAARQSARRIGDLLRLPEVEGRRDNPAEVLGMLVGLNLAYPVMRPGEAPSPEASRFNAVSMRRLGTSEHLGRTVGMASRRLGLGVQGSLLDMVVLDRVTNGQGNVEDVMAFIAPVENCAKVREAVEYSLRRRMPVLREAGVF